MTIAVEYETVEEAARAYVAVLEGPANAYGQHRHPVYGLSHNMLYLCSVKFGNFKMADAVTAAFKERPKAVPVARDGKPWDTSINRSWLLDGPHKGDAGRWQAHRAYWGEVARRMGLSSVSGFDAADIKARIAAGDKHLNTIPMHRWDAAAAPYGAQLRKVLMTMGEYGGAPADGVCLVKELARQMADREG